MAREADLHAAFTSQGISRLNYYRHSTDPLWEKLIAGLTALLFVGLVAYTLMVSGRFLIRDDGLKSRSGTWLAIAWALVFLTKILDRSGQVPGAELWASAFEEGLEAIMPFAFIVSAWISQDERRYLS